MKAKEALAKIEFYELEATKVYDFRLTPCNEGHSMTYLETFKGSVQELFARCDEIVNGLKEIFPLGDFSVLIENSTFDNYVSYVPSIGILDNNGDLLLNFNESNSNDINRTSY